MPTESVAHALVRQLAAHGVRHLFLNPGTDTAPVQEALLALREAGEAVPEVVLCPHEAVALAAAHAYVALTGRPQVVMVHVDVGTQNLGSMVHNADRAGAGVVILAGRTPVTADGSAPGGRDSLVHWMQDVPDQAGVVRPYVRLVADLETPATVSRQVNRAFQVAAAGPVYLTAGRELLMAPAAGDPVPPDRYGPPSRPAPDPAALARAAAALAGARDPVVVTTRSGRDPATVPLLVELVDRLGARVADGRDAMNFPSDHPAYLRSTAAVRRAVREADVLLLVDAPVPWVPAAGEPRPDATVVSLDADPARLGMPGWSFPVDVNVHTDPRLGLAALLAALPGPARARPPATADPVPPPGSGPVTPAEVGRALAAVLAPSDVLIEEATTSHEVLRTVLPRTEPGTVLRSGGSGLGWALGAAVGAGLADPGRRRVCVVGDGAFLFGEPAAALWCQQAYQTPALTVVLRNGGYAASRAPVLTLFPDGVSARRGEVLGTLFRDAPDLAALARSCGAHAEHVADRDRLAPALAAAVRAVDGGRSAVLVVEVDSPWT